ncbi:MAG: DUF1330 domain-containing protein [Verrucomicrobiae bacterium]|nr:DUF1330 domain-containing protein [Verrucomicrobiae bacterium]
MAAFLIADIEVKDAETYQDYIRQVPALVAKHGGVYRARGGDLAVKEGTWKPNRLVILEFPDRESAEAFYNDPDYQPPKAIRLSSTNANIVIVDGI